MKFSFLVSSILLGATARTATATGCCLADETLDCPTDYVDVAFDGTVTIHGVLPAKRCCLPDSQDITSFGPEDICPGTVAPNTGDSETTTTTTTDTTEDPEVATTTNTGGATATGCCLADETLGCPTDYEEHNVSSSSTIMIHGVLPAKRCCLPDSQDINSFGTEDICPGTVAPNTGDSETTTTTTTTPTTGNVVSTTTTTPTTTGNTGAAPSGAGILSSASATFIGASVAIIAIFV